MAKEKDERGLEDVQREIAEVQLETAKQSLAMAKRSNEEFKVKEQRRHEANKRRMNELAEGRRNHEATVRACKHKSGGSPNNILKGGRIGSFSIISRAIMPDGVTILLQCPRCRMKLFPPELGLKKSDPNRYTTELENYNRLLAQSRDEGIDNAEIRGPTFMFQNAQGVPVIPERA